MREDKARGRHLQWLVPVVIVLLVAVVARLFLTRREGDIPEVYPVDGVLDITGMDLSQTVVNVNNSWDFYPNALYTSADFASGGADRLPEGEGETRYGTYRLIIKAQPERYYTLCSYSIDYSTRVFVNGVEAAGFGTVADNAAESVPQIGYMTIPL